MVVASHAAELSLQGGCPGLRDCGAWHVGSPQTKGGPISPALAGGFLTATGPPGKSTFSIGTFILIGKRHGFILNIHSLLITLSALLHSSQQARNRPGGLHCHFPVSCCSDLSFTPYPTSNDNFWPLKIKKKAQEPERLRVKLIFKVTNLSIYSCLLRRVPVIFKIRFSSGYFTLKMMKFLVPCNCISFDFLLL